MTSLACHQSPEQEKLEFARSRPALAERLNGSIIRLAGMDTQRVTRGRPREPRVDGGDPGEFEILEGNPTDGCDLEFVATDSMSCLERMIRFTAALLGTMKQLDDPEVSLAAELDLCVLSIVINGPNIRRARPRLAAVYGGARRRVRGPRLRPYA